jgi:hypothetical protein
MRHLACEYFRANPQKSWGSMTAIALAVAMMLACVGTRQGIGPHPNMARIMLGDWLAGLFLFVAVTALAFVAIGRYTEVVERTTEFGILTVLGASRQTLAVLLLWETLMLAVPGAILGMAFTALIRIVVAAFFSRGLQVELALAWWPVAVLVAACASMAGGVSGLSRTVRDGMVEVLSYRK